jgi:hypothetical protein
MIDAAELARLRERAESQSLGLVQFSGKQVLSLLDALEQARVRAEHLDWAHGRMVAERDAARAEATLAEREACAKHFEQYGKWYSGPEIADAIRARK